MSAESAFRRFVCFQGFNLVFVSRFFTACGFSTQKAGSTGHGRPSLAISKRLGFPRPWRYLNILSEISSKGKFFSLLGLAKVTFFGCASELLSS